MQVKVDEVQAASNRPMEIANLYHKQSLELINLALTHNKQAIDASHNRATELLRVKDTKNIHELVTAHMSSQVRDYLNFATEAYQLGFDAHAEVANIFHQQIIDSRALTNEMLKHHALAGNPVSSMALSIVNGALHTSQSLIDSAKAAAAKTVQSAKSALLSKSKY
jgi:Phasin protein